MVKNEKTTGAAEESGSDLSGGGPGKSSLLFGEVEDVISVGALMRPTLEKAMQTLSPEERLDLKKVLLEVETHLSNASCTYRERFQLIRETFVRTFRYGPIWRFISNRIEECWMNASSPDHKEFSMVSLLVGMIFEELNRNPVSLTQNSELLKKRAI
jgi:hypothetical protein